MFRCFKQASETKDEMERRSLEYRQEGNVAEAPTGSPTDAADAAAGEIKPPKEKDNPRTVKAKTTLQMAKSVP